MKNNQAILNTLRKKIYFIFNDEFFIIDLTEGDLDDNWNSIIDQNGVVWDTNFYWDTSCDDSEYPNTPPSLSIYPLVHNGEYMEADTKSPISIKIVTIVGGVEEYFK